MSISLYTPVGKVVKREFDLSPRVDSLDGLVVGLLDNNKWNAQRLLRQLDVDLRGRFAVKDVVSRRKPFFSRPAPLELIEEMTAADVVVTALAD